MHLPFDINLTYIIGAFLLSLPGYLTWWSSRQEAKQAAKKVEEVRDTLETTSSNLNDNIEKIHVAVNSERTAMLAKIEDMHTVILGLTQRNRALEEKTNE